MFKALLDKIRTTDSEKTSFEEKEQSSTSQGLDTDKNLSTDKIKAIVAQIHGHSNTFVSAGFVMEQLDIEIGLKSRITPHFKQTREISPEEQSALLEQTSDSSLIQFVLMSLFRSKKMEGLFENTEMSFHEVAIDITSEPCVRTTFKRNALDTSESTPPEIEVTRH